MIYFLHGLFTGLEIWSPYLRDHSLALSLYEKDPLDLRLTPEDTLVGYSLGGRIALELAERHEFRIKRLILLAAHPGLPDEERSERERWENKILHLMKTSTRLDFMAYWNGQDLFSRSEIPYVSPERFSRSIELFDRFRLSRQKNFISRLVQHKEKILYLHGDQDRRYQQIALDLASRGIMTRRIAGDHRIYLNKTELIPIFEETLR